MTEVMRPSRQLTRVFLYRKPVDFRKSFNGLSAIVEQELAHNIFDGALYAFTNRRRISKQCCMRPGWHRGKARRPDNYRIQPNLYF